MFCQKCGAKMPDDASFCDQCGTPVHNASAAPQPGDVSQANGGVPPYAPIPAAPSPLRQFFSVKRNLILTAAAAAVVLIGIILLIVLLSGPKTVYIDNYFDIVYTGCNGYATPSVKWDEEALAKLDDKVFRKKKPELDDSILGALADQIFQSVSLRHLVNVSFSYDSAYLSNGDKITVKYTPLIPDLEKTYDIKLKLRKDEIKVKGLTEPVAINPTEQVTISFSGYSGYGYAEVKVPAGDTPIGETGYSSRYESTGDGFRLMIIRNEDKYVLHTLYYRLNKAGALSEGDKLLCSAGDPAEINRALAESVGLSIPEAPVEYTVSGLTRLTLFDPSEHLNPTFSGFSGYGSIALEASQSGVQISDYTVKLLPDTSNNRCLVTLEVCDAAGNTLRSLRYTADKTRSFANGDTITFELSTDESALEADYGITLPATFGITVNGLEAPVDPKPFDRLNVVFSGYEGYGMLDMTVTEEVYTVGGYTFKLTPTLEVEGWSRNCSLTIVVANAQGANLFTVEYRSNDFYNIEANGKSVTFDCRTGSYELERIATEYGIFFEESHAFTVSGLKPTVSVNPREMLTFSFVGENGSIALEFGLKESLITVGDYKINLTFKNEVRWSTHYATLTFTMTDASGNLLAEGGYTASSGWLNEGDTISIHPDFNRDDIASATGVLFDNDSQQLIVSTK